MYINDCEVAQGFGTSGKRATGFKALTPETPYVDDDEQEHRLTEKFTRTARMAGTVVRAAVIENRPTPSDQSD